jgi:hypothetical protein
MDFKIGGVNRHVEVTTIVLEYNPNLIQKDTVEGLMLWHCPIDNTPLFQYSAKMVAIMPGMIPTKIPVIHQCPKCKTKYLISQII